MVDDLYANITDANFTNNTVKATSSFARTGRDRHRHAADIPRRSAGAGNGHCCFIHSVFETVARYGVNNLAAYQKPELITAPQNGASLVIPVDTFQVVNAPNLPTNNGNVTGFGCSKSALIIATRLPNDYTTRQSRRQLRQRAGDHRILTSGLR